MQKLHCNSCIVCANRGTTTSCVFAGKLWEGPPHTHKGVPDVHIYVCIWDPFVCLGWARPSFQAKKSICCGTSIGTHYARIAMQFLHTLMGFYGSGDFCISPPDPDKHQKGISSLSEFCFTSSFNTKGSSSGFFDHKSLVLHK